MNKHSTGPWKFKADGVFGNDGKMEDCVCELSKNWGYETYQANGRLVAAAPDLLQVVYNFLSLQEGMDPETTKEVINDAYAAIAKARPPK